MGHHPIDAIVRKATNPEHNRLGDEEEAWYRHDSVSESVGYIKKSLRHHESATQSGSSLGAEEDAWVRPDD